MLAIPLLLSVVAPSPPPPPAPPPPVVVTPAAASPMRYVAGSGSNLPATTQTIAIQVRQDGHVLWSGDVMRASTGMAAFSQQLRETRACASDPQTPWQAGGIRNTSTSTVRFETHVSLPAGKPVTVDGESGLSVTLVRR